MNTPSDMQFKEIEHKFVVTDAFDISSFLDAVRACGPEKDYQTEVTDTYFLLRAVPNLVYRHRFDGMIQHLTTKSVSKNDSENRLEINLHLDLSDQKRNIEAFLEPFGIEWSGTLHKKVQVFYFSDVEIVFYQARFGEKEVNCIELEARSPACLDSAIKCITLWERKLGLNPEERCHQSLLHLLVLPTLPSSLKEKIARM